MDKTLRALLIVVLVLTAAVLAVLLFGSLAMGWMMAGGMMSGMMGSGAGGMMGNLSGMSGPALLFLAIVTVLIVGGVFGALVWALRRPHDGGD
jgi:hypothetical protein